MYCQLEGRIIVGDFSHFISDGEGRRTDSDACYVVGVLDGAQQFPVLDFYNLELLSRDYDGMKFVFGDGEMEITVWSGEWRCLFVWVREYEFVGGFGYFECVESSIVI